MERADKDGIPKVAQDLGFAESSVRKIGARSLPTLQKDLDEWLDYYNNHRTHQGKMCCGRAPMATLCDGKSVWKEKFLG